MKAIRYVDYFIGITTIILWGCTVGLILTIQLPSPTPAGRILEESFWVGVAATLGGVAMCLGSSLGFRVQSVLGIALGAWWVIEALRVQDPIGPLGFAAVVLSSAYYSHVRHRYFKTALVEASDLDLAGSRFAGDSGRRAIQRGGFYQAELVIVIGLYLVGFVGAMSFVVPNLMRSAAGA